MIQLKSLTMKNFLSTGAVTQCVDFNNQGLTLVLGENLDLGGNGSRNGVGKSTLFNGLSYALYGQAISNIKRDNLINTVNKKNMSVTVEFEKDGVNHRIERGRRPNFFKYQVNDQTIEGDGSDEAQGENKDTQKDIDQTLGLSWSMFRHIVCLNTYTEPFLMMGSGKQREIIEELLGITLLSQKAETLKELIKLTKSKVDGEEFKLNTIKSSNQRILNAARDLENKIINWDNQRCGQLLQLEEAITALASLDVEREIQSHKNNVMRTEIVSEHRSIGRELAVTNQQRDQLKREHQRVMQQQSSLHSHSCPSCGQTVHDTQKQLMQAQVDAALVKSSDEISLLDPVVAALTQALLDLETQRDLVPQEPTIYSTLEAAYDHRNSLLQLEREKQRVSVEQNPFVDQLASLNNTLQETSYDEINSLTELKEHQEFLLKLLTNKDSFIRKRIIDQNLSYLNHRLMEYLSTLGITHEVTFKNDLTVEINYMGQDMDFAQLSRGESTRVILSLSWAFRDIWENTNNSINFLGVDELIDVGLDSAGVERAIEILKNMARDRNKSVFLISHRDELLPRCDHVLSVIKENGFTRLSNEWDSL